MDARCHACGWTGKWSEVVVNKQVFKGGVTEFTYACPECKVSGRCSMQETYHGDIGDQTQGVGDVGRG